MNDDHSPRFGRFALAVAAVALTTTSLPAQAVEHDYVTPLAGTATQRFGYAMAVDGDVMVAGAPYEDTNHVNSGAAFVFRWDAIAETWIEEQELFPSDPEASASFGKAVAVDGDVIAVGAPLEDNANGTDAGAAYVFRFDATTRVWSEEIKLIESGGWTGNQFGDAVAVDGTGLVVGASMCDMPWGVDSGCAFVYRDVGAPLLWAVEVMLSDPYGGWADRAGQSVAIEGDLVMVAAPQSREFGVSNAGSVAVWRRSGSVWWYDQRLTSSHRSKDDRFGLGVALGGDLALIGAPFEDHDPTTVDGGAAYVFRFDGSSFAEEQRLVHPTPAAGQRFGSGVDIDGKLAVVGVNFDDSAGSDAGCAFTFRERRTKWYVDLPLVASDAAANDHLGMQVAIHEHQVLVAADGNNTAAGVDWGVVYGYLAPEIGVEIAPTHPAPDQAITCDVNYGAPGSTFILAVFEIDSTPVFVPLAIDVFGSGSTWSMVENAPNPLFGMQLGVRAYKVSVTGALAISELEFVDI